MTAFDAETGRTLWTEKLQKTSHHCPEDLFVIGGQIWSPNTGKPQQKGTHYKVFDLHTGSINKDFVAENIQGFPMHPRCYPSRATQRYIMTNGMGTEFYELGGTKVDVNNTVRGSCIYGVMPANGLLYKPPDSCACYYQSKLEYFCALAPKQEETAESKPANRLEEGPAFEKIERSVAVDSSADWPMYRRDEKRSGYNPTQVASDLSEEWEVELGGKLTQPVIADSRVFVAAVNQQTLYALDANNGKALWQFTAGGRIDSSPTIYKGSVLFGCADGWAYCLRAADGALAWRYLVAPGDRQLVAFQQLESVWPVHGSLLVQNDIVYCLAGRNMFFDGGLRLALLDPMSGRELAVRKLDENDPETGQNLQTLIEAKYMPVANADLFSSNGKNLFMQTQKFDFEGNRINIAPIQPGNEPPDMAGDLHLFCPTGFLDTTWFHRSYWILGNNCGEGWGAYARPRNSNPAGRIMAFDQSRAYSFRSEPLGNMLHPRQTYVLFASDLKPAVTKLPENSEQRAKRKRSKKAQQAKESIHVHWHLESPELLVNAMVIGGNTLFVAGPPDLADERKMLGYLPGANDDMNRQLRQQEGAWQGKHGGVLWAVATQDGKKLAAYQLDSYPVFDGLVTAQGRLFMSMLDGTVRCYE
jgi:outer membrane protein assembly factor BamB